MKRGRAGLYRWKSKESAMTNPTAAMLVIGDEILSGRTQDSSGAGAGPDLDQNVLSVGVRFFP